jgi:serine/threonine-protein kinase
VTSARPPVAPRPHTAAPPAAAATTPAPGAIAPFRAKPITPAAGVPAPASSGPASARAPVSLRSAAVGKSPAEAVVTPQPGQVNAPPQIRELELSDPELQAAAEAIAKRMPRMTDPEVSLDIPPPADIAPPDERPAGSKDPYIGTTFDHRYKIQKLLGEGGMGFVYLARHKVIDKKVAVKVLRSEMAKDREILDRFLQEAKAASSIGNPHIIDISDFGDLPDGSTYFVMEYLEGQSLGDLVVATKQLSVERICHIARQMSDGLAAAHERGIIHRDLKPDNIFLIHRGSDQDFVKILDFGIAKVTGSATDTKLTKAGAVFGTPHYMSPEQAAGAPIDHRADIYALGVMLYELTSGQLPFNADNFMGILTQHMYKAPAPIRSLVPSPSCPPSLEAVILKCLSKKQEARYQSMEELGADLQRIESGSVPLAVAEMMARSGGFNVPVDYFNPPSAVVPATPPAPQKKKWSRLVWSAGAAVAVGLVTTILVISNIVTGSPPPKVAPPAAASIAPPATASAAPVEPKKNSVVIAALPMIAMGYRDDKPFKLPSSIDVEEGKTVSIEVRAEGYETAKVDLDGKETSKTVELKPLKSGPGIKGAGTSKPAGSGKLPVVKKGPGETVDPWNMKK